MLTTVNITPIASTSTTIPNGSNHVLVLNLYNINYAQPSVSNGDI